MILLRQSTASQEIPLGYFVDSTDGNTEETGLTIANTDIKLWKTGATTLASKNSGGATHISNGIYYCTLDATDTDTIGPMVVFVHVSGALTARVECCVLDEAVYDVLFGTTAPSTYAGADTSGTTALLSRIGTPANLGSGATVAANLTDIEGQTDDIGTAGAGLTAVPWNAAWDAEVQSEVDDALVVHRLDELINADSDIDGAAPPAVGSVFHELLSKTAGSFTFDQTTDSLEALRDRGDAAWITATGFSTHAAADVWSVATRVLTAATNITSTGGTITVSSGGVQAYDLTAAARAQVNAEVVDVISTDTPIDGKSIEAALEYIAAMVAGKVSGAGTGEEVFKGLDGTTTRVTATVDPSGNRPGMTYA